MDQGVRLAELVAALSLGVDLGFGQPMEHILRQCLIALRIADVLGLDDEDERAAIYYAALLVSVGCHSDAHEQARWFGDDIGLKATKYDHEPFSVSDALGMLRLIGAGGTPLHRVRVGLDLAFNHRREINVMLANHARLGRALGEQLGLSRSTLEILVWSYERWDGRGWPGERKGEDIPIGSRVVQLADFVEVAHRVGGVEEARALATRRAGSQFDPMIAETFCLDAEKILHGLDDVSSWAQVIDAEPALGIVLGPDETDAALLAIADFVDLKSPYTLGHSGAVAELAAGAGRRMGIRDEDEIRLLRRGGLVHDFGRLGVSNGIWDKEGPLGAGEWERVRMHPYMAARRGGGGCLPGHARAPSPPSGPQRREAAAELRADVRAGRLDADAVEAVLAAAGHRVSRRREGPARLTAREIEVLRLLARGLSNKEIAARLVIAPKTAGNHVEHIYAKTGATNRATASLFAVQHGLLPENDLEPTG